MIRDLEALAEAPGIIAAIDYLLWEALLRIPQVALTTDGDLARWVGRPTASRAVGAAVGAI
ncbi:MAG: MGMT family protein [Thiohalocapsa sp.]